MDLLQDARYQKTPVYLFFEKYILDVIGELSNDKETVLQQINLQATFNTKQSAWKDVIREVLHLSSTIDTAILFQWYKTVEEHQIQSTSADSDIFCKRFVNDYFKENSNIDVWTDDTLSAAKIFIIESREVEVI